MLFYGVKHPVGYVSCSKTFMGRLFLREREREFWFRAVCRPGKWESLACQLCFRKCQNILDEFQKYLYLFIFLKEVRSLGFVPVPSRGCFCDLSTFSRAGKCISCSTVLFPGLIIVGWEHSYIGIIYIYIDI